MPSFSNLSTTGVPDVSIQLRPPLRPVPCRRLPLTLQVASVEGIASMYIHRMLSGQRGTPGDNSRHSRLAAAYLLHLLCHDWEAHEMEATFGQPQALTREGEPGDEGVEGRALRSRPPPMASGQRAWHVGFLYSSVESVRTPRL